MPATRHFPLPTNDRSMLPPAADMGQVGGSVASLQRSIEERLRSADAAYALDPMPLDLAERAIQMVSRTAGPLLLAAGFAAIAALIF